MLICSNHRAKSLILWGPTRTGKTTWARSLGKHLYFGGLFNIDDYREDCEYAVFDDMQGGLEFLHSYKFWLGCQKEFNVTDKYRHKKRVKWGKPCIYLSNQDPRADRGVDVEWLEGNCDFQYVGGDEIIASVRANIEPSP
jgi:hypothetical protein